jgi:hypothetical protein
LGWNAYPRVFEQTRGYRLLRTEPKRCYIFIPRRAFQSDSDEGQFRELVGAHLETGAFRPRKVLKNART